MKSSFINFGKKYTLPILFISGLGLILIYYFFKWFSNQYFQIHITGFKEIFGIGLTITGSGIFLAALKWFQFMGFFREEINGIISSSEFDKKLEDSIYNVVYADSFLSKRSDLEALWSRVNRALFKNQFSEELAQKIEHKMQDLFFHNSNLSHYYKNFIQTLNINLGEDDYLTFNITLETKIIRESVDKFGYNISFFVGKETPEDTKASMIYNRITIDKNDVDINGVQEVIEDDKRITKSINIELEGQREYLLYTDLTMIYKLDEKEEYQLFAERFLDYVRVSVNFSPNLVVVFVPVGNEAFDEVQKSANGFVKVYSDILLPEKGFRLIFIKKND